MTTDSLPASRPRSTTGGPHGRLLGAVGMLMLVSVFVDLGGDPMFTDASNTEVLRWVHGHVTDLYVGGFIEFCAMLLNAAFLVGLALRARLSGPLLGVVWGLVGGSLAIDAVNVGSQYALAKSAERGAGSDALLALFSFAEQLTFTDGITWGIVIAIVAAASLRTHTLSAPVCWLGLFVAALHLLGVPVQLAWTGTVAGATGPIGTAVLLVWWLATSLTLLLRPRRAAEPYPPADSLAS